MAEGENGEAREELSFSIVLFNGRQDNVKETMTWTASWPGFWDAPAL